MGVKTFLNVKLTLTVFCGRMVYNAGPDSLLSNPDSISLFFLSSMTSGVSIPSLTDCKPDGVSSLRDGVLNTSEENWPKWGRNLSGKQTSMVVLTKISEKLTSLKKLEKTWKRLGKEQEKSRKGAGKEQEGSRKRAGK